MRKKIVIWGSIVILTGVVVGSVLVLKNSKRNSTDTNIRTMTDVEMKELSQPTDYYAPGIDEVKNKNIDPDQRYSELMGYGYSKELVRKYDQAIVYYKSATEEDVAEEKVQEAQYKVYQLAVKIKDKSLIDEYQKLLGQEFLDKKQGSKEVYSD